MPQFMTTSIIGGHPGKSYFLVIMDNAPKNIPGYVNMGTHYSGMVNIGVHT